MLAWFEDPEYPEVAEMLASLDAIEAELRQINAALVTGEYGRIDKHNKAALALIRGAG